ncbi:MAG: deoxyribose-phosphate aldolase [Nitrospirae bacterium GWC2_57_13]|jgi:deoxyribose-phosphate aldolase|nr:MAG: deoxyribose-phosphate aldolase [Nitrospirae bacterium GWC2_57_13]OGW46831.1 MAG: deoxyribose-phosphate aldolase [Nitrospirae bacterium GWD2_57_8]HAS54347.1 deoxyribose-phosphate aldolase [Nitrospiraceae bacterium]
MFENIKSLAGLIDSTLVRPDATLQDLAVACDDARTCGFAALIVSSGLVKKAQELLAGSPVKVGAVIGFPHGACTTTVKIVEAMEALKNGAQELDIMINVGLLRSGAADRVEIDVKNVITMTSQALHKVILETGCLTATEIAEGSRIALRAGAAFLKTSTGFGFRGATVDDVKTIRAAVGSACRIKASGGIRDLASAQALVEAGADRIGTSAGRAIVEEFRRTETGR